MAVNIVVQDGVVKSPTLRYATDGKPEFRFTLVQQEKDWPLYLPCCAVGAAAERLASEIEDGQHVVISSGKLCYRKRTTKAGEQSRMEILCWQVDRLSESTGPGQADTPERTNGLEPAAVNLGNTGAVPGPKARKPRLPKHLQRPWQPEHAN
jgi:single-stranded DNA-binding protein